MARKFSVPGFFNSPVIATVKSQRAAADPRKRDLTPSVLDCGAVRFTIARNFGFCFGVEQAVDIAYRTLERYPDRRQFMLSEMIHNPHVNEDLRSRGMQFLRTSSGEELIPLSVLTPEDIVVIPAFGTTLEIKAELQALGVDVKSFDTTCPFVTKVWRRSEQMGRKHYTVIVHGKHYHEESRATFSHAQRNAPVVVVRNEEEARDLAAVITRDRTTEYFYERFEGRYSRGFDPDRDLRRIGVVNQTTMLVSETLAVTRILRDAIERRFGGGDHFIDTSDTLCYATYENQEAARRMLEEPLDLALIVGGYNSSNTSQIVRLCEESVPTFFINNSEDIRSVGSIRHYDLPAQAVTETSGWLPAKRPLLIALTAGASCPDILLDQVMRRIIQLVPDADPVEAAIERFAVSA
ncbi:MAG: 4-hydroxy-3-methylbut-2-enyl diphosphate reductase [Bacteroidota bacterium]|nr:4-hydroxy-3-methylbut-2-enyl diphosphate reductase [Bacteroidota bacterium]MDE2833603.1 4-hydroxy-3-methylbut-2-enyl diphosphate reductase [Bacteroidota bacterium]MDE2958190.1 4-hydroxy-3-methylbut-2-enyl diphosphate reductase [Bacteroidota bacterium]